MPPHYPHRNPRRFRLLGGATAASSIFHTLTLRQRSGGDLPYKNCSPETNIAREVTAAAVMSHHSSSSPHSAPLRRLQHLHTVPPHDESRWTPRATQANSVPCECHVTSGEGRGDARRPQSREAFTALDWLGRASAAVQVKRSITGVLRQARFSGTPSPFQAFVLIKTSGQERRRRPLFL